MRRHAGRLHGRHHRGWPLTDNPFNPTTPNVATPAPPRGAAGLRADLIWGVAWGVGLSSFLAIIAIVEVIIGMGFSSAALRMISLALLIYLSGAVAGGIIVGLLRPSLHSRFGAAVAGALATIPVAIAIRILGKGFVPVTGEDYFVVGGYCLLLGVPVALNFRHRFGRR